MITEGSQQMRSWPHKLAAVLALLGSIGVACRAQSSGSETPKNIPKSSAKPQKYDAPTDPSSYVGAETCKACHEDIYNNFETTPHFVTTMESKLDARKGPEWHGCEACHGPGKDHVEGGGDKTKIFTFKDAVPADTTSRCLRQLRSDLELLQNRPGCYGRKSAVLCRRRVSACGSWCFLESAEPAV